MPPKTLWWPLEMLSFQAEILTPIVQQITIHVLNLLA